MSCFSPYVLVSRLMGGVHRFRRDEGGNFAVMTGLMILPLIGMGGLALDYWKASTAKSALENAADAAALAAINRASAVMQLATKDSAAAIAAGIEAGRSQFRANANKILDTSVTEPVVTVTYNALTFSSSVSWNGVTKANFAGLVGAGDFSLSGASQSSVTMPGYVTIHILIDSSASMGIAASQPDQVRLYNEVGCALSCHIDLPPGHSEYKRSGGISTYDYARARGIDTRIDVVRNGVRQIVERAKAIRSKPDQYAIGVYLFSGDPVELIAPTTNLDAVLTATDRILMARDGGSTDVQTAMTYVTDKLRVARRGDGTSIEKPKNFVLFLTDGMSSRAAYNVATRTWYHDQEMTPFQPTFRWDTSGLNPAHCDGPKSLSHVTLMPLNIEYIIPAANIRGDHVEGRFDFIESQILPLQDERFRQCATGGKFYKSRTSEEIISALQAMFEETIPKAPRLVR